MPYALVTGGTADGDHLVVAVQEQKLRLRRSRHHARQGKPARRCRNALAQPASSDCHCPSLLGAGGA